MNPRMQSKGQMAPSILVAQHLTAFVVACVTTFDSNICLGFFILFFVYLDSLSESLLHVGQVRVERTVVTNSWSNRRDRSSPSTKSLQVNAYEGWQNPGIHSLWFAYLHVVHRNYYHYYYSFFLPGTFRQRRWIKCFASPKFLWRLGSEQQVYKTLVCGNGLPWELYL